ncbi:uncharacterized protein LOC112085192 [Eutrema salsugineum]|uniref:uncharacterized protein LOC112085192 n=1 Tax=Eutrema salsugineum TaxID=72664 RepID=UPI000CED27C4|nr:uncharacterized protein LOC112085192 [Eutrema salsugineum]
MLFSFLGAGFSGRTPIRLPVCSCMIFLRLTNGAKLLIKKWIEKLQDQPQSKANDQPAFNWALNKTAHQIAVAGIINLLLSDRSTLRIDQTLFHPTPFSFSTIFPETMTESMRSTAKDEELVSKLNAALKKHDKKFFLSEILVCAKEDEIDARRRSKIATPECPVTYIKPPDTQLICDGCHDEFRPSFAADKELLIKFLRHAHEHPGSVILTVVASDSSFSWSIGDLVSDGFTVLSAVKERASRVAYASSVVWLWEGMQQEDAPFVTRQMRTRT